MLSIADLDHLTPNFVGVTFPALGISKNLSSTWPIPSLLAADKMLTEVSPLELEDVSALESGERCCSALSRNLKPKTLTQRQDVAGPQGAVSRLPPLRLRD